MSYLSLWPLYFKTRILAMPTDRFWVSCCSDYISYTSIFTFRILYANDLQVYVWTSLDSVLEEITSVLAVNQSVSDWTIDNCLRLNASKTKAIVLINNAVDKIKSINMTCIALRNRKIHNFAESNGSFWSYFTSSLSKSFNQFFFFFLSTVKNSDFVPKLIVLWFLGIFLVFIF